MSITLHHKLGVNPHLTYCPRCGGDGPDLMLIGDRTTIRECVGCKCRLYGFRSNEKCNKCGSWGPHSQVGTIQEGEKLPGSLCKECEKELAEWNALVAKGAIFFRCKQCNQQGVIRAESGLAKAVRKQLKVEPPAACGVEFETCDQHTPKEEAK